jgi:putative PIN family toxin of toxin-antitoxin system
MKVFFDTNVYVAEALDGRAAVEMLLATRRAGWRIHCSSYVTDEIRRVLVENLGFPPALASKSIDHVTRRANLFITPPPSRHHVPQDANDSPILQAALASGADYLITNDQHLLALHPYEGLRIISMSTYYDVLMTEGLLF